MTILHNKAYIAKAIDANKDATWKILINHVPLYSFGGGFDEPPVLRERFAEMDIDSFDFDVVFTGHQHRYSRSKQLLTTVTDYTEYTNTSGTTIKYLKPTVVSENKVIHSDDGNGHQIDTVTDPDGAVHINLPSVSFYDGKGAHPDYEDFIEAFAVGASATQIYSHSEEEVVDDLMMKGSGSGHYMGITITKNEAGQQMKLEYVDGPSNSVIDTYIINKTLAE